MFPKKLPLKPAPAPQSPPSSSESQPLIEQVDPNYQPTQRQIRQYAIQTLGMHLPQDNNLLYLAKQGLKAPIPVNWVPYQSRTGDIYYKHKITQERSQEHPTDVQYRRKYEQMKEKAMRKNLKSIAMRGGSEIGLGLGIGAGLGIGSSLGMGVGNGSVLGDERVLGNLSHFSADNQQATIDQGMLQEWQQQVQQYQKKQQTQWRQMEKELQQEHKQKMKKIKQQYQEERNRLGNKTRNGGEGRNQWKIIEEQRKRLQQSLQEAEESTLLHEMKIVEKEEENKLEQYRAVYEEDTKIKIRKVEEQLQQSYREKVAAIQQKLHKMQQKRRQQQQNRQQTLQKTKAQLQQPNNPQIAALLQSTLADNLNQIQQNYANKLKTKQEELQSQLQEMKRILGVDKGHNLLALASKKEKLMALSTMKVNSIRNKQMGVLENQNQRELEKQITKLKQKLMKQHQQSLQMYRKQLQQSHLKAKNQIQSHYSQLTETQIQSLNQSMQAMKNNYQSTMNNRLSELRMAYISQLTKKQPVKSNLGGNNNNNKQTNATINRLILQQKQQQLLTKQSLVLNLQHQLQTQRRELRTLQWQTELSKILERDPQLLDQHLKRKVKSLGLGYQSAQVQEYQKQYARVSARYKEDKKVLGMVMKGLQQTTAYAVQEMRRSGGQNGLGSAMVIKKYNEDVRKMRENQQQLLFFQSMLRKVQGNINYEQNLQKLREFLTQKFQYKQITIKQQLQSNPGNIFTQYQSNNLQELQQPNPTTATTKKTALLTKINSNNYPLSMQMPITTNTRTGSIEQTLRQHSRFLADVKNDLNRKLYQVRYEGRL